MVMVSYEKLRVMMVKRRLEWKDIRIIFEFAPRTITKLKEDQPVRMDTILQLCDYFECDISDIMEVRHIKEPKL